MADFVLNQVPRITEELETLRQFEQTTYKPSANDKTLFTKWDMVALQGRMNAATKKIRWLGAIDKMREMIDEAKFYNFREYDLSVVAKKYQTGIVLSVEDIEDNLEGDYLDQVRMITQAIKRLPAELIHNLIVNGTSDLCYDGQAFFANAHPCSMSSGTTFDNLLSGTLSETTISTGRVAMMKFPNDRGEILGLQPDLIVIPPELEVTAMKLINSQYTNAVSTTEGSNTINTVYRAYDYIVDPLLTDSNDWYMLHTSFLKPFLFYERKAPYFEYDDTERVTRDILKWSLKYRVGVQYGLPQCAIKFVN